MKKRGLNTVLLWALLGILVLLGLLLLFRWFQRPHKESFTSETSTETGDGVVVHYYWVMSDKRKPLMLEQLRDRNRLSEADIQIVPGIFDDNVEQTGHPNLPKEWLSYPVARLLAAHMKAIRLFRDDVRKREDGKEHVLVCLEDDIALHHNFEAIVKDAATHILPFKNQATRVAIGYASPPGNKTEMGTIQEGKHTISRLGSAYGDPWGTVGFMLNRTFAEQAIEKYEKAYTSYNPEKGSSSLAADLFIYDIPDSQHLIVEPPACVEDNPTFESTLGHSHNAGLYQALTAKYDRELYYRFKEGTRVAA